jgi:long-chain acyl-CoA synthetase
MARFKNLQELFLTASARFADRIAFRHIHNGKVREIAYRQLSKLTYQAAQALWKRGVRPGDYLGICANNSPEWVLACFGAFRIGAIVVPLDARSRASEVLPIIDKVEPRLILFGERQFILFSDRVPKARMELLQRLFIEQPLPEIPHLQSPSREDPALIVFTSGTAGTAKGVVLTHGNILSNVVAAANAFEVSNEDRLLSVLPLSHMLEFTGGLAGPLHKGATIVYCQPKGPSHLKELLKFEKVSVLLATPLVFQSITEDIESKLEQLPKSKQLQVALLRRIVFQNPALGKILLKELHKELGGNIKFWLAGGAPTPPELVETLRSLGITLLIGYGLTEAAPIVAANTRSNQKATSVGVPLAGVEVRIDNADALGIGEILVKGPNVMQGYWNNPDETTKALVNGWLKTGDSGSIDSDGHLHVNGRMKSVIVTAGGYNLYPEELEEALSKSAIIKEACVFGQPSSRGEVVCAALVVHDSVANSPDRDELIKHEIGQLLSELADYKRLQSFQVLDQQLPRTASGKVRRGEIVRLFELAQQKKKSSKKSNQSSFAWDEDGKQVCDVISQVMDPAILRGICPSGSRYFSPEMSLSADLGLDSFARLDLVFRLEQQFSVDVPDTAVQEAQTVEDLVILAKYLLQQQSEQPAKTEGQEDLLPEQRTEWKSWPVEHHDPSTWPLRDDPIVTTSRKVLEIAARTAIKVYNQFETAGTDRLLLDPPYIVAANHASHFDCIALLASFPQHLLSIVHPVAAADYFFSDSWRSAFSTYLLNAVPFDRYGNFEESMKTCEQLLRKGHILIIFPEGTRSTGGQIGPFKPGAARLSITVGCPIIPAYVKGTNEILPKGNFIPQPAPLEVSFGLPLYPPLADPTVSTCQEFSGMLRNAVIRLRDAEETIQQVTIFPSESADA